MQKLWKSNSPELVKIEGAFIPQVVGCRNSLFIGKGLEPDDSVLGKSILGGVELPDVKGVMGDGPVSYLLPTEVQDVHAALKEFPIEAKVQQFNPEIAKSVRVYVPGHGREELVQYFKWLSAFYSDAAQSNEAMLHWIQ